MGLFDFFKKKNKEEAYVPQTIASEQQEKEIPLNEQSMSFDSQEYQDHLKSIADSLSAEDREQILTYIQNNTQIFAIKLCREATGIGLKEAKDLIDDYEKYFTK